MKIQGLEKLGHVGVAGLGLLLFCLSFALGNVVPAHGELSELRQQKARLMADSVARNAPGPDGTVRGRGGLPPFETAPEVLLRLNAAAEKNGLQVARTSYQLKEKSGQVRLEVTLPVKGGYPSLRSYLREAMALPAPGVINDLSLQRGQASDPALEAQLRLSYAFAGRGS